MTNQDNGPIARVVITADQLAYVNSELASIQQGMSRVVQEAVDDPTTREIASSLAVTAALLSQAFAILGSVPGVLPENGVAG